MAQTTPDAGPHFAVNLKRRRKSSELSQEHVVEEMRRRGFGFHPTTLSRIENGQRQVPIAEALALAEIVGSTVNRMAYPPDEDEYHEALATLTKVVSDARGELAAATRKMLQAQLQLSALVMMVGGRPGGEALMVKMVATDALDRSPADAVIGAMAEFAELEAPDEATREQMKTGVAEAKRKFEKRG